MVASGFLDEAARQRLGGLNPNAGRILDGSPRGISVVVGPEGTPVSPILQDEEGLLYAEIDLSRTVAPRQIHDVAGGYNRFDIFKLSLDRSRRPPLNFEAGDPRLESTDVEPNDEGRS